MTQAVGAHSTYDEPIATGGNREDLSAIMKDVSPTETPFLSLAGSNKATATNHEWLTDSLAVAADNAHIEGDDTTGVDPSSRVRNGNYTQIFKKTAVVTGTQEKADKGGGVKSEMAYQMARRMKEIKLDCERAVVGVSNVKVAGSDTVAREMGSLDTYLVTNNQFASGSSAVTGNGVDVSDYAGIDRALTQDIFNTALEALYTNSGGNSNVTALVPAAQKGVISGFTNSDSRYVTTNDKKLVSSIDVYVGDFHTVSVVPDRHVLEGNVFIMDSEYVKMSDFRPAFSEDLAKNGDATRKHIVWECTLEVTNEKGHCHIADLI